MSQRQHPARLPSLQPSSPRTVQHPAARLDLLALQVSEGFLIKVIQLIGRNVQHQTAFKVSVGDRVTGGEPIGVLGSTGNTTGPHVHVEVRTPDGTPIDPYAAFLAHGVTP